MNVRRYYDRRKKYDRVILPEVNDVTQYLAIMESKGYEKEAALAIDNAEYEVLLTLDEEDTWMEDCLNRVIENPRWYLDNLEHLTTFRVHKLHLYPNKKY